MNGSNTRNSLEVETRFRILDRIVPGSTPFSDIELTITKHLGAKKVRSLEPAVDIYHDISKDFYNSTTNKEFHRLRLHTICEDGVPTIRQTKQTKRMVRGPENDYGIEAWLETKNLAVRDLNKEIKNLKKQGCYFLPVYGSRHSYLIDFGDFPLEINFDRMLSPPGCYIEVGREDHVKPHHVEKAAEAYTVVVRNFIKSSLQAELEKLGIKTESMPVYPLILLKQK